MGRVILVAIILILLVVMLLIHGATQSCSIATPVQETCQLQSWWSVTLSLAAAAAAIKHVHDYYSW